MASRLTQPQDRRTLMDAGPKLYFAYGSNLDFEQMANRCRTSRFVGRGRLHRYSFQINERGFANLVKTNNPRDFVDGLCYRLMQSDEASLDRSEGVPHAYQKITLDIEYFPVSPHLVGRDVVDIVRTRPAEADNAVLNDMLSTLSKRNVGILPIKDTGPVQPRHDPLAGSKADSSSSQSPRTPKIGLKRSLSVPPVQHNNNLFRGAHIAAMVYISECHVTPGRPWDEYMIRMRRGFNEALQQGVSVIYVQHVISQWLQKGKGTRLVQQAHVVSVPMRNTKRDVSESLPSTTTNANKRSYVTGDAGIIQKRSKAAPKPENEDSTRTDA